jgi:hypothetical protein
MKAKEIFEKYPLSTEAMREWFKAKLVESFKEFNEDEAFKGAMLELGVDDEQLTRVVEAGPHMLFELFDNNEIYVSIFYYYNEKQWGFSINETHANFNGQFSSRKATEHAAMLKGLGKLEITLKEKLNQNTEEDETETDQTTD